MAVQVRQHINQIAWQLETMCRQVPLLLVLATTSSPIRHNTLVSRHATLQVSWYQAEVTPQY